MPKHELDRSHFDAHAYSTNNYESVRSSDKCGCFSCVKIFSPSEISEWVGEDDSKCAICPFCDIDSIIGSNAGFELDTEFLECMNWVWFRIKPSFSDDTLYNIDQKTLTDLDSLASQGNPSALFELGKMYYAGVPVKPDPPRALNYLTKAAKAGLKEAKEALADLNFDLGDLENWSKVQMDLAENGNPSDQLKFARQLERFDIKQAIYWFKRAAMMRNLDAALHLARIYESGYHPFYLGEDEDFLVDPTQSNHWYKVAFELLKELSEKDDIRALNELAASYREGGSLTNGRVNLEKAEEYEKRIKQIEKENKEI